MWRLLVACTLVIIHSQSNSFSQPGGVGTYGFLNLTTTPRVAALGGKIAVLDEPYLGIVFHNPAALSSQLHNHISLSYVSYYSGIRYGSAIYARHVGRVGSFAVGLTQVDYGSFIQADPMGQITGSFTAADLAVNLVYSKSIDSLFTVGVNIKPVYSHLESYSSLGIAADIAAAYNSSNGLFSGGVVLRNLGKTLKPYVKGSHESPPFEIVAGFSKKLAHAPFRFVVTLHQLQDMDIHYSKPSIPNDPFSFAEESNSSKFDDMGNEALSHLILGVEFIPVRSFYLRVGYNYQRRNELRIVEKVSTVGFSWGVGIKISKFHISYSQSKFHLSGSTNHFSISTGLEELFKPNKL